jgi:hypothetical protein
MLTTSEHIAQILWNNVDTLWYNRSGYTPNPEINVRTYEILESITKSIPQLFGNKVHVEIFFDEDKIKPHSRGEFSSKPFFNEHMSMNGDTEYEGRSIGSWVIEFMEDGQGAGSNSYAPYEGVKFFEKTIKKVGHEDTGKITASLRNFVIAEYRRRGVTIKL